MSAYGLEPSGPKQNPVVGPCEHRNKYSVSIKGESSAAEEVVCSIELACISSEIITHTKILQILAEM
jgi:hypothetical protein